MSDQPDILRYFRFEHLPEGPLFDTSSRFHHLAQAVVDTLPDNAERAVALRKLLEAKDAAVRSALDEVAGFPRETEKREPTPFILAPTYAAASGIAEEVGLDGGPRSFVYLGSADRLRGSRNVILYRRSDYPIPGRIQGELHLLAHCAEEQHLIGNDIIRERWTR